MPGGGAGSRARAWRKSGIQIYARDNVNTARFTVNNVWGIAVGHDLYPLPPVPAPGELLVRHISISAFFALILLIYESAYFKEQ